MHLVRYMCVLCVRPPGDGVRPVSPEPGAVGLPRQARGFSVHHATRAHGLYLTDPWRLSLIGPAGARSAGSQSGSPAGQ